MAFSASALTGSLAKKWSIGPFKIEIQKFSAASGDTSGTVTAKALSSVDLALVCGSLVLSSDTTYSSNVATLAFADPVATVKGLVILLGR